MLKNLLSKASKSDYALGHFNFADSITLSAIVSACKEARSPVFIGTSEGESSFLGLEYAVFLRDAVSKESGLPVFLNADHFKSYDMAKAAIDAGYDSVQIDASKLSFEENITLSKKVVEYAKKVSADISVEGELGYIRGSSEILKEEIDITPDDLTSPVDAKKFVEETGVDRLAVAIGNIHGISVKGNPKLDLQRLQEINDAIPGIALTLHGGSGISDKDIKESLSLGMSNVHVNTEIRVAFSNSLRETLDKNDETTPYKYFSEAHKAAKNVVLGKLSLFGAENVLE